MGVLLAILGLLFLSLFIIIPLVEKYGRERSPEELSRISKWIAPLMAIALVAMAFRYFFQ